MAFSLLPLSVVGFSIGVALLAEVLQWFFVFRSAALLNVLLLLPAKSLALGPG